MATAMIANNEACNRARHPKHGPAVYCGPASFLCRSECLSKPLSVREPRLRTTRLNYARAEPAIANATRPMPDVTAAFTYCLDDRSDTDPGPYLGIRDPHSGLVDQGAP